MRTYRRGGLLLSNLLYKSFYISNKLCESDSKKSISTKSRFLSYTQLPFLKLYIHFRCLINKIKLQKLQRKNLEFFRFKTYRQNKRIIVAVLYYFSLLDMKDKIMLKIA